MRLRHRAPAAASAPWALLSYLLRYPTPEIVAARPQLAAEIAALPAGPVHDALAGFLDGWTGDQTALAAQYVETFDLRRRATLELTYYAHGDTRERGMALLRLKKLYRAAGLPMDSAELPDHLTVMLAFAALAAPEHGRALLAEHRAAIELLRLSLHDLGSPYAGVLDAIAAALVPLTVSERSEVARLAREGPPDEAVGLEPYGPPEAMPSGAPASADAVRCGGERSETA
jgi:nitrate reductase molybdenum cofactor assembly chaperone NarJ/NarW